MSYQYFTVVAIILLASLGVDGLFCFKCLNIDCSGEDLECQRIRSFVQAELKHLYYFGNYLDPCPQLNETYNWRLMQVSDEPCPEEKAKEATCTLGRMQVKTTVTSPDGKSTIRYNHATVMGCANRQLLQRIKYAFESAGTCDLVLQNQTSVGLVRELQIEHYREISNQCYEKDYCVGWRSSVIKPWADLKQGRSFEYTLQIGIFALVVIVMIALLVAGLCREPASRISNVPKSIGTESEMVKVLQVKDKEEKNKLSSIEVDQHSQNGSINKRPSMPPPPPPRLHRPVVRESTPV